MPDTINVTQFLGAALIFLAVITGMFYLVGQSNPLADTSTYQSGAEGFNTTYTLTNELQEKTQGTETKNFVELALDAVNFLLTVTVDIVDQVFSALADIKTAINIIGTNLHLPYWLTNLAIGLLTMTLVFAVIAVWRRYHP